MFVLGLDVLDGDPVLLDVVVGQPVPHLEPRVTQVALVRPVVGVCRLVVQQVFALDEPHAAQFARVRPVLRRDVDSHVHPQILLAEELLAARVAGEVLDSDVVLDDVLLEGVLVLEGGGALRAGEHVLRVHLRNRDQLHDDFILNYQKLLFNNK